MNLDFLTESNIYVYLFIFFGKILEVSLATIRIVLINRGERKKGTIVAFFESIMWVIVTGTVLVGFQSDVIKVVIFCVAFAIGNFVGSWIEGKIALGLSTMQVICDDNGIADEVVNRLRELNLAVTVIGSEGKTGKKKLLLIHLKRNRTAKIVKEINKISASLVITISDVKNVFGGFIKK